MSLRKLLKRLAFLAWSATAWALTLLALSSYLAYTTAGFDFEYPTSTGFEVHYFRLRWDDGATWIGLAIQPIPRPDRPLDWFDPGGTILAAPSKPIHRSRWNDLGFWRVETPSDDPYVAIRYPGASSSRWWACPSWLVLLALWHRSAGRFVKHRWRMACPRERRDVC